MTADQKKLASGHPPQERAVGVKSLEWEPLGVHFYRARTPLIGSIRIERYGEDYIVCWSVPGYCDSFVDGEFETVELAKAAAQTEYERCIRAALATEGQP